MQVEIDVTCMHASFGGLGFFGFGDIIDIRVNERDWKLPYLYIDFVYH